MSTIPSPTTLTAHHLVGRSEAARICNRSESTITNLAARGEIASVLIGRRRRLYSRADVLAYAERIQAGRAATRPAS